MGVFEASGHRPDTRRNPIRGSAKGIDAFIRWVVYRPNVLTGRETPPQRATEPVGIGNGSRRAMCRKFRYLCIPDSTGRKDPENAINTSPRADRSSCFIRSAGRISGLLSASDLAAPGNVSYEGGKSKSRLADSHSLTLSDGPMSYSGRGNDHGAELPRIRGSQFARSRCPFRNQGPRRLP